MKIAVDFQSELCPAAVTTRLIQLSPSSIDSPLCCDWSAAGMTNETAGSVPAAASVKKALLSTEWARWVSLEMQSAKLGQMPQMYDSGLCPEEIFHETPASGMRSL